MNNILTKEQKEQFSEILDSLGKNLDISETQYEAAVNSYTAVGEWLSKEESELAPYKPEIKPQGSFMLGTMVKPVHEDDDLDIDLVCQLTGKKPEWTQSHLKQIVGDRLKAHDTYKKILIRPDGRRCWTLRYSDTANYHMDILPSIVSVGYTIVLEKSFSDVDKVDYESLAIRITDRNHPFYTTAVRPEDWLKSNSFGYGKWFFQRARLDIVKAFSLRDSIQPVPKYRKDKLPLHRIVQILKRHRDLMFNGSEDKPISIIITTLAAKAYQKETDIITGLLNVLNIMTSPTFIEERYDDRYGRKIKWIANPVNPEENFADKWPDNPQKEANFYKWVNQVRIDVNSALNQVGRGLNYIQNAMEGPFGSRDVTKTFSDYGENMRLLREQGKQYTTAKAGIFGTAGTLVKDHNFHGNGH